MLIAKASLTVLFATAGLWLFSDPLTPAETDAAGSAPSAAYEELIQTTDINYFAAQAEF